MSMFKKVMKADVGFKTDNGQGLEVRVVGFKPLIKAGMYQLIRQVAEDTGKTVEQFCHEMIEMDKSVKLEMAEHNLKAEETFNVAFKQVMEQDADEAVRSLGGLLAALLGGDEEDLEAFMPDHTHNCDDCGAYNMCNLPSKKPRE